MHINNGRLLGSTTQFLEFCQFLFQIRYTIIILTCDFQFIIARQ